MYNLTINGVIRLTTDKDVSEADLISMINRDIHAQFGVYPGTVRVVNQIETKKGTGPGRPRHEDICIEWVIVIRSHDSGALVLPSLGAVAAGDVVIY